MRLTFAFSTLLVLAAHVRSMPPVARVIANEPVDYSLMRHHNYLARKVARQAHAVINHEAYHQRNVVQSAPVASSSSAAVASPAASSKAQAVTTAPRTWKNQTAAACVKSLSVLNGKASNPSGLAACYNVQSWNSNTGIFEADLQLYRIAAATGDWVALMTQAVNVGLSYSGATVAPRGGNNKRSQGVSSQTASEPQVFAKPQLRRAGAAAASPNMVKDMSFVGRVNKDFMGQVNDT